eukprot:IDg7351t1
MAMQTHRRAVNYFGAGGGWCRPGRGGAGRMKMAFLERFSGLAWAGAAAVTRCRRCAQRVALPSCSIIKCSVDPMNCVEWSGCLRIGFTDEESDWLLESK